MKVLVLMSTFNGEKYITEQLESLIQQVGIELSILVRDDGSSDRTVDILKEYESKNLLTWYSGENLKTAHSFFDLIQKASRFDYYAFCDQDDVWDKEKLVKAIEKISRIDKNIPTMYFSKATLFDENLNEIKGGVYPTQSYSFGTALLRNNVTGCTIVFNSKLMEYSKKYTPERVLMHDHWIYLLCLALGGEVIFDPNSYIKYRQHDKSVIGGSRNLKRVFMRSSLFDKENIRLNIAKQIYDNYHEYIPLKNINILLKVINYQKSFIDKLKLILDKDIKNVSILLDFWFYFIVLLNRF